MKKPQIIIIVFLISLSICALASMQAKAAGLDHFVVSAPGSVTAGSVFTLTVTAKNASENTVTSYNSSVGLNASSGSISPTSTGTSGWSSGVWSSSSVTLSAAGSITITANDGSGHTGTATLTVTAGSLDHITASVSPASVTAGSTSTGTATAFDAQNNNLGVVSASWSIPAGGDGGSWSSNVYTSHTAGTYTVQAAYSGRLRRLL
jgi:hypothetical protein